MGMHTNLNGVSTIQMGQAQTPHQYEVIKTGSSPMSTQSPTYIAVSASSSSGHHGNQLYTTQYNGQHYGTTPGGVTTIQGKLVYCELDCALILNQQG